MHTTRTTFESVLSCSKRKIYHQNDSPFRKPGPARKALSVIVSLTLLSLIFTLIIPAPSVHAASIDSRVEPVVVTGAEIPSFIGKSTNEIWVYAYTGSSWVQIPFQIDQRNDANGSYFHNAGDGLLDANDEIVFMPGDCQQAASTFSRVPEAEPQRYRIRISDPLDSSEKYAYIYASQTLVRTNFYDYVDYNQSSYKIEAEGYTLGYNGSSSAVITLMSVSPPAGGDGNDILDRFKYRFQKSIIGPPEQYNEDDFTQRIAGLRDGPVRVIRALGRELKTPDFSYYVNDTIFAYGRYFTTRQHMLTNISTDWIEITMDFLSTATPMTYYDSGANELTIDGIPETPSNITAPKWFQVSGSRGSLVGVGNFSEMGIDTYLMYTDNSGNPDDPESESGEYGNCGIWSGSSPNNSTNFLSYYVLPASEDNVGENYLNFSEKSLVTAVVSEVIDPSPPPDITAVTPTPNPQEVGGLVNISAQVTDNLNELYSVHVKITNPQGSEVGNFTTEYDQGAGRYFYLDSYPLLGTYDFEIWAVDKSGNWNSFAGQFDTVDTTQSEIVNVTILPNPQGVGSPINISADIKDAVAVSSAFINISSPNGSLAGNFSMEKGAGVGRFFFLTSFITVGNYTFTIFTNDTSDNWNDSGPHTFTILDTQPPQADAGESQEVLEGSIVLFNASLSTDNVGIVNYTWTFTDITSRTLYGKNPAYRFNNTGSFFVKLNVTDDKNNWAVDFVWVNVTKIVLNGSISGTITNTEGGPIAGAKVTLEGTLYSATTDGTGYYVIQNVPAGIYNLTVSRDNYKDQKRSNVVVVAGQSTSDVQVTMSKTNSAPDEGNAGVLVLLVIIIIVVVLILVLLLIRSKKEGEREIVEEVVEEVHFLCPECSTRVDFSMDVCPGCGAEFRDRKDLKPVEEVARPKESPADIYMCPSCGSFVSSHAAICEKCGFNFDEERHEENQDTTEIPAGFLKPKGKSKKKDGYDEKVIPPELADKVIKQVEEIIKDNGLEIEELEVELEVETLGEADSKEDLGKTYETLSKEIEDILDSEKKKKKKPTNEPADEEATED